VADVHPARGVAGARGRPDRLKATSSASSFSALLTAKLDIDGPGRPGSVRSPAQDAPNHPDRPPRTRPTRPGRAHTPISRSGGRDRRLRACQNGQITPPKLDLLTKCLSRCSNGQISPIRTNLTVSTGPPPRDRRQRAIPDLFSAEVRQDRTLTPVGDLFKAEVRWNARSCQTVLRIAVPARRDSITPPRTRTRGSEQMYLTPNESSHLPMPYLVVVSMDTTTHGFTRKTLPLCSPT
jgi:hypothetical protein